MKRLVKLLTIFILVFFALDNVIYYCCNYIYRHSSYFSFTKLRAIDVLYFGTSRTQCGIDPKRIEDKTGLYGYNVAGNGAGVVYSKALGSVFLKYYYPKLFVIEVMPLNEDRRALNFIPPLFFDKDVYRLVKYYPFNIRLRYCIFKSVRFNSFILGLAKQIVLRPKANSDFVPLFGHRQKKYFEENLQERIFFEKTFEGEKMGERFITGLIDDAKDRNIDVVFVRMPLKEGYYEEDFDVYNRLAIRHNIKIVDLSREVLRLSDDDFYDFLHVNEKGMEKLCECLAAKLQEELGQRGK
jgi:hypothetical protein